MREIDVRRRFEARILILQGFFVFLLIVLFAQLVRLQWLEHQRLALQAERNRINILPVLPVRGEIFDRNGRGLALNRIAYRVLMIPERVEDKERTLETLGRMLHWSDAKRARIARRIRAARPDRPVLLDDKLSWQDVAGIAARLHQLPGIDVAAGTYRFYPYGELTSHLIGYLSLAGPEDLKAGFLPTEFVGRTGVERVFESTLHGRPGTQREEVDAHGRRVAVLDGTPPEMGKSLRLTLDVDLQQAAAQALGKRTGAVVAMDATTGDILVLLSRPGFDPNRFITGLETEQWNAWLKDARKPLLNRTTQAIYPPGSTFKPIVAIAGLRNGLPLIGAQTTCPGFLELADRKLRCWKREGHGRIGLHRALVESCDVYFYELGDALGMAAISTEAARWGLGERTGIALSPESRGVIPAQNPSLTPLMDQPDAARRMRWFRGETMITAIGQGAVAVTPLQMARVAAAIANGGKILKPRIAIDEPVRIVRQVPLDPAWLGKIRRALRDVVASPTGTAHAALSRAAWPVAGKTGTAQVIAMGDDEEDSHLPERERHRDHAWFIGYAPFDAPRIAFAVFVEHGGHGGSAAAPVARAIVDALAAKDAGREAAR